MNKQHIKLAYNKLKNIPLDLKKRLYLKRHLKKSNISLPPQLMMDKVRKGTVRDIDFFSEGKQAYDSIIQIIDENDINLSGNIIKILEFGCGCGRIARHFYSSTDIEYYGTDVDSTLVEWCKENIPKFHFITNKYNPPLPYDNNKFDIIYSISVFTHLPVDSQSKWFSELHRVIKKGGILIISIIEKKPEELPQGVRVKERIDDSINRAWLGVNENPTVYYSANHTLDYIKETLSGLFEILSVKHKQIRGKQTLIKMIAIK